MRKLLLLALLAAAACAPAGSEGDPADQVSQESLRGSVETLVGFGTRHTLSSRTDPKRGIGAALRWTEGRFAEFSRACGGCLEVSAPSTVVSGERVPDPTPLTDIIAVQRGTSEPNRVVIISGHIDSRASDVMQADVPAPGANDDGSGTAAVIEAARVLSQHRFPATIVYAVLSGEEQGLYGGELLADIAKQRGWQIEAVLNNDIVGNSCGSDGLCDNRHVRVFSEAVRGDADEALLEDQRRMGGENDSPSRNLSRFIAALADRQGTGIAVRQVWRADRFGRGGDHLMMQKAGFPAVRFTVAVENYNRQHQDPRVEAGVAYGDTVEAMDFAYLAKVTRLNVAALAALARAPRPPAPVAEGAVSTDTVVRWEPVPKAARYRLSWRATDAPAWSRSLLVPAGATEYVLEGVRVDDWMFGVSAISPDGHESPVASAVPGGAFRPLAKAAAQD